MCCLKWNGYPDDLIPKKASSLCNGLNAGSSYISQGEVMPESLVENLEKDLGPCLIWTGGLKSH